MPASLTRGIQPEKLNQFKEAVSSDHLTVQAAIRVLVDATLEAGSVRRVQFAVDAMKKREREEGGWR